MGAKEIRAGRAYVELATKDNLLIKGLASAGTRLKNWGKAVTMAGAQVAAAGAAIAAPLVASLGLYADVGSQLDDMAQRTGIAASSLSELAHAAQMGGSDLATVEKAVIKMQKALGSGEVGKATQETLKELGLNAEKLQKLTPEEQFTAIGEAIAKVEDPTKRAAVAMELFGKSGTALLPMLSTMAEFRQQAKELGFVMSDEGAATAAELADSWDFLKGTAKWLSVAIGEALAPAVIDILKWIQPLATAGLKWVQSNKQLVVWIGKLAIGLVAAGAAIAAVGMGLILAGTLISSTVTVIGALGAGLSFVLGILGALMSPIALVGVAIAGLAGYFLYTSGAAGDAVDYLSSVFGSLVSDAKASFGAIGKALAAGDIALAGKVLWLALKLQWEKGMNALHGLWAGFRDTMLNMWLSLKTSLAETMISLWPTLKKAASIGMEAYLKTIFKGLELYYQAQQALFGKDVSKEMMGLFALNVAFSAKGETDRAKIDQEAQGAIDQLEADAARERAAREQSTFDELQGAAGELADATAAWQDAVNQANALPAAPSAKSTRPEAELPDEEGVRATATKYSASGSFNAQIAAQIGAETSYQDRIAKAGEKTAKNTDAIRRQLPKFT